MKNQISIKEISKKLKDIFPQVADKYEIISLKSNYSEVKLLSNNKNLRPGNTISGPSMFELADLSFYIAIMASTDLGDKSVTTNVSINFIKKPLLSNLLAISSLSVLRKGLHNSSNESSVGKVGFLAFLNLIIWWERRSNSLLFGSMLRGGGGDFRQARGHPGPT